MSQYSFHSTQKMLELCQELNLDLADLCLKREMEIIDQSADHIESVLRHRLNVMEKSIFNSLQNPRETMGKMGGKIAYNLQKYLEENGYKELMMGELAIKAAMYSIANNENNACMGCIVACPTAGASGVVPGVLFATKEYFHWTEEQMMKALLVAAGLGSVIAFNATVSGAEGGCQAEIGSAVAMAAAALTYLRKGTPEQCMQAAALSLKNLLGLACDPIGGMVEVPCIKRNGFAAQYALLGSDLAIMGVKSYIPLDEIIDSMRNIGNEMNANIRETALGGLAATKTAQTTCQNLGIIIK
ncbi:MAG TPA: L-serine ammonia-lyase, iron-sulfur-dependent, subunit alpha [Candidatus Gracilibacteria bacterium]|nr:L-serine ammonia-lyase, iron-sulfur-dependent, subunit alpha [Candidatus Gracilibacteria bacterium]